MHASRAEPVPGELENELNYSCSLLLSAFMTQAEYQTIAKNM